MTPKEKALQLVEKFIKYCRNHKTKQHMIQSAKQCATIAVDEILETFIPKNNRNYLCDEIEYWQKVKKEITNL